MINTAGATLIAEVYPIGLILLLINGKRVLRVRGTAGVERIAKIVVGAFACVALFGVLISEPICVVAVSQGAPVEGAQAVILVGAGAALIIAVGACLGELFADAIKGKDN